MASTPDTQQSLLREAPMEMIVSQLLILDQISDRATYDALIPSLLENIGQITHANRAYIFSIHEEEECYYRNAYEWCQDGVTRRSRTCSMSPPPSSRTGMARSGAEKAISIWDLETVRDTMPAEYEILHAQDIRSIAVLPIFAAGKFVGFIGLDDPDQSVYDIASKMLQVISGHLGCIRSHLDAQETLRESRAQLESQLISSSARPIWSMPSPRTTAASSAAISRRIPPKRSRDPLAARPAHPASSASGCAKPMMSTSSMPPRRFPFLFDRKQLLAALSAKQILNYRLEVVPDEAGHRYLEVQIAPLHSVEDGQHKIAIGIRSIDDLVLREKCLEAKKRERENICNSARISSLRSGRSTAPSIFSTWIKALTWKSQVSPPTRTPSETKGF